MKLGKESLLAIIESALFVIGAGFFAYALMTNTNPIWAFVVGILFGLAGAILWSYSLLARFLRHHKTASAADISQQIQGADNPENNTYELHRAESYDNLADEAISNPTGDQE